MKFLLLPLTVKIKIAKYSRITLDHEIAKIFIHENSLFYGMYMCMYMYMYVHILTVGREIFAVETFRGFAIQCITRIFRDFYFRGYRKPRNFHYSPINLYLCIK